MSYSQYTYLNVIAVLDHTFLSHIAFDVFVDEQARFPLFAPFSFNEFMIPTVYALPIEAVAALITYLYYVGFYRHHFKARLGVVVKDEKQESQRIKRKEFTIGEPYYVISQDYDFQVLKAANK